LGNSKMAEEKYRQLVRIVNTDVDGNSPVGHAIKNIRGVGFTFAKAVCYAAKIDGNIKSGALNAAQLEKLEDVIKNPSKYSIPTWLYNRRKDPETGANLHLVTSELDFAKNNDVRLLKKIKAYKGIRHMFGQPVRGQRTRSNFRRNKGKPMGVIRSKAMKAAVAEKAAGK
jgi:small subunit ribosomal protein S13